jgi:hypothetical protein
MLILGFLSSVAAQEKQLATPQLTQKATEMVIQRAFVKWETGGLIDAALMKQVNRLAFKSFTAESTGNCDIGDDCAFGPTYCSCYCGEVQAYCESIGQQVLFCNCGGGWSCVQEICC